ncbi:MAG: RsmE family RNA methyltransferase [Eubacteriales bacterium]|nr:RsmE family RNA methyltransferase [Eubacteriales bacterium]
MRRVVLACPLAPDLAIQLTPEQRHYLFNVLRMGAGEQFIGLDQDGQAFVIRLEPDGRGIVLEPAAEAGREPEVAVRLFLPLLKGDKLDLVVQKSVELGVAGITLYSARRAVVKEGNLEKKLARLQRIALEATQQCRRQLVPAVSGLLTLEQVAASGSGLFAWEQEDEQELKSGLAACSGQAISLLTGPEGGLAPEEVALLTEAGWTPVTLGPRILRAETAAIAMLTCVMFARGEMG